MKTIFPICLILILALEIPAQINLNVELVTTVFNKPVDITHAGDDRLFIVEKDGRIQILQDEQVNDTPFLDIDPLVRSNESERGLLGLAFHPNYAENGYFFVNYTDNGGNTVIARYAVSSGDPDLANPGSAKVLLTVEQPFSNHNAGDLNFGPDGYLYIALGDGGSANDPLNNSQSTQTFLGKILRIDVDQGDPYAIPADNPFIEVGNIPNEVWAFGLRNPWRFSFDRLTGDLWIGDVGQNDIEEIDFQPADSPGGENYGWRCYEGNNSFNTANCGPASDYTFPVHTYPSEMPTGCSVNGGFVYRGNAFPLLYGLYLYSDYCSGRIWALSKNESGEWENTELWNGPNFEYATMGEDKNGELYLASLEGDVFRITEQTTGTGENSLPANIRITPNPIGNHFQVVAELPESGQYSLQLLDAQGRQVWEETAVLNTSFRKDIDTAMLSKGIYLFVIEKGGKRKVMKLVKQ